MPLIRKREWAMPDGTTVPNWVVDWLDQDGRQRRNMFYRYDEAEVFFVGLAWTFRGRSERRRRCGTRAV
jgi:hypothetical protein